jgi:hypothetical protein
MKKRTVKDFIALYAQEDGEKLVLIQSGTSADKTFLDTFSSTSCASTNPHSPREASMTNTRMCSRSMRSRSSSMLQQAGKP